MSIRPWINLRTFLPIVAGSLMLIAVACGGAAATPVVIEKEVIKEVVKEVPVIKEVVKEVPVEVVVEKEVIKEVVREVVVVATPAAVPTQPPTIKGEYGGIFIKKGVC